MRDRLARRVAAAFVDAVSALVPGGARREFRDEWRAELTCLSGNAARTALRASGALPDALALLRQEWSLDMLLQDLRYALRLMARRYGLTALVVLTLGLGIGANTAVFSVIDGVLLRPLPFADDSRLVAIWEDDRLNARPKYPVAPANYLDWLNQSRSFESLSAYVQNTVDLTGAGEPARLGAAVVWPTFFDTLGARPLMGRTFTMDDAKGQNFRVAVLSHRAWTTHLSSDPNVVGREITLSDRKYRVVGVMASHFGFPDRAVDVWRPMVLPPATASVRAQHFFRVVGRLRSGVTWEQMREDLNGIAKRAQHLYPRTNDQRGVTVVPLREEIVGDVRQWLYAVAGAVAIVLLIGCANVANLLLAAGTGRRREIAVRAALGAGRTRIIRLLLAEGLVLAAAGGATGMLFAVWGTRLLAATGSAWLPRASEVTIDTRVLVFAGCVSLVTGLLFALAPAVHASRTDLQESLKEGSGPAGQGLKTRRAGAALAVVEMALAVVLVVASALLLRSFWNLQQVPAGFNPNGVLTARVSLPASRYDTTERIASFQASLIERLRELPGVRAVGAVNALPMTGPAPTSWLTLDGRPRPEGEPPEVGLRAATPGYFQAMQIALVEGRQLSAQDTSTAALVAVVNRALVDRFFRETRAIGSRIKLGPNPNAPLRTIVGIVDDVKHRGLESFADPEVYLPLTQNGWSDVTLTVRTSGDPGAIAPAVRTALQTIDRDLPLSAVATMQDVMSESMARRRLTMTLLGALAGLALLLAATGVYGVMAYAVSQRTLEIGVRMALGARGSEVVVMVVRQGLALAAVGLALGLAVAAAVNRVMATLLFGIESTDPATYAAVATGVMTVAAFACFVPARRAASVDPVRALRS